MKLNRNFNRYSVGVSQLVLASVGFGFLGIFGKIAFRNGLDIGALLTYRFTLAALLLWIGCLLFKPQLVRLEKNQIFISALLGILGYAIFSTLYFTAIKGVTVALASLLLYTYPFWVSLCSHWVLKERMNTKQWLCLLGASIGLAILMWGKIEVSNWFAVAAGLGSALTYAIYILVSARFQKEVNPLSSSLYVISFTAFALYLFHRPNMGAALELSTEQARSVIGIAIICTILPLTLILAGLQKMKSSEAALLTMIEPITASIVAFILFNESLSARQLIGAMLVLGALTASTLTDKK